MEVLHRVESGFYSLAKVIEEAGEGESKKTCAYRISKVQEESLGCGREPGARATIEIGIAGHALGGQARWFCIGRGS